MWELGHGELTKMSVFGVYFQNFQKFLKNLNPKNPVKIRRFYIWTKFIYDLLITFFEKGLYFCGKIRYNKGVRLRDPLKYEASSLTNNGGTKDENNND
jgi:hypothetical protein